MPGPKKAWPGWLRYSSLGFELAGAVAGLTLVGYWIDRHYGTTPWGLLIGALLGLIGGMYNLIRESLRGSQEGPGEPPGRRGSS